MESVSKYEKIHEIIQTFFTTIPRSIIPSSCLVVDEPGNRLENLSISELKNISLDIEKVYRIYGNGILVTDGILNGKQIAMNRIISYYAIWIARNKIRLKDIPQITEWPSELIDYFMKVGAPTYKWHKKLKKRKQK